MRTLVIGLLGALVAGAVSAKEQPKLSVVAVYEGMASYADAVATNPTADRHALWQEKVLNPYWQRCAEGGEFVDYAPPLKTPFADIDSLRKATTALRASAVESVVRSAVEKSASLLPAAETTVCVIAADSSWTYLQNMHGVGGFTPGAGKVWLTVLPAGDWQDWIAYATAHEYHHSAWASRHGTHDPIQDMADYLVFEGRADSFARLVEPRSAPWTQALTSSQKKAAWEIIQRNLRSTSPELLQALMFGGAEGVPPWAGYTIGFEIVQSFLGKHSDLGVSEWTAIAATDLLDQASYDPKR